MAALHYGSPVFERYKQPLSSVVFSAVVAGGVLWTACSSVPTYQQSAALPLDAAAPAPTPDGGVLETGVKYRLFVTSDTVSGGFAVNASAEALANEKCASAARSKNLGGTWVALFWSDLTRSPTTFVRDSPRGWYQVTADGGPGALVLSRFAGGSGRQPAPILNEKGNPSADTVWTGGGPGPDAGGRNCDDWSELSANFGTYGDPNVATIAWMSAGISENCAEPKALYCIEQ